MATLAWETSSAAPSGAMPHRAGAAVISRSLETSRASGVGQVRIRSTQHDNITRGGEVLPCTFSKVLLVSDIMHALMKDTDSQTDRQTDKQIDKQTDGRSLPRELSRFSTSGFHSSSRKTTVKIFNIESSLLFSISYFEF